MKQTLVARHRCGRSARLMVRSRKFRLRASLGDDAFSIGRGTGRSNSPQRERLGLMKCMTCNTSDLSDDELDFHARVSHNQLSGDELKHLFKELSEELAA